jgi:Ca-activated chloride channel homolog
VHSVPQHPSFEMIGRLLVAASLLFGLPAFAQIPNVPYGPDSRFEQLEVLQLYLDKLDPHVHGIEQQEANKNLVDSGLVSALDLAAPNSAVGQFNLAQSLMQKQHSEEAIKHLQKAIRIYPKFVSAHVSLGLAYIDQGDAGSARTEFETAEKLDEKFPASFLSLGLLSLSQKDFTTAQSELEKAASLSPRDARTLLTLAYAQHGTHNYPQSIETAQRVHALDHKGMANVHYVAAASAMAINDAGIMQRELGFFLSEDPTNAFAPRARKNLDALARNSLTAPAGTRAQHVVNLSTPQGFHTFPNSERLKAELSALGEDPAGGPCGDCGPPVEGNVAPASTPPSNPLLGPSNEPAAAWTIRKSVDDVALFFSVSSHGHMVNDLELPDIRIRDDNKPPVKVLQFAPQSKLPLRLALLVDTSGSVHDRFSFEKHAAENFVQKVLSNPADLAFIAGFSNDATVPQDFTADQAALATGIEKLANGGGTALFDAVSFACWKLAEYPDDERVARVVVILSDGEDNASRRSLKQSIQIAEMTGVTVYTISTREDRGHKTDADRVLEVLAQSSGGEAMFPGDMMTLGKSFDQLRDLIRSRYFIAYKPAEFQPNGSYRTINILAEKDGKHLQVRARKGYHARVEKPN